MRITFVLPHATLCGGIRVVSAYAARLAQRGHDVHVVSLPARQPGPRESLRLLLKERRWPWPPRISPSHLDGLGISHGVLDRYRPIRDADVPDADVVIATWWETAHWVEALSARKGAKVYFIQGDEASLYEQQDPRQAAAASTWSLPMVRIVVASWLEALARERGVEDLIHVVPNGVDLGQFHAPVRGKGATPTVGMMYSPVRGKGSDVCIAAATRARERLPSLRLIAFGAEPPIPTLALPKWADFHLAPPQDRIPGLYALCDAWLFGSRREGFGLPLLEAMGCRTPVIATPTGAAPELVAGGGGVMVAPENSDEMARAIIQVAAMDEGSWRRMSDAARATAQQHDWDRSTALFEVALEQASRCPGKGRSRAGLETEQLSGSSSAGVRAVRR